MALTPASILADYSSSIGPQGATLRVNTNEKRVGIGTTNPQGTLQVGTAITMGSGIITATGGIDAIGIQSGGVNIATGIITALNFIGAGNTIAVNGTVVDISIAGGAIYSVAEDTTPQLGGNLDLNGNNITGTGNLDITGTATFSGNVSVGGVLTYEDVTNVDSVGLITARSGIIATGVVTATSFVGDLIGTASNATNLNNQAASYYLNYNNFSNTPTIPTNNNQLTNGAGYTTFDGNYNSLTNLPTIPTNNNQLTNGAGYITSFDITTQTDPKYLRSDTDDAASGTVTFNGVVNIRSALDLADNDILRFGSGDDAEFFCNGTHFYLDLNSGIGNFYIRDGTTTRYTFDDNGSFTATGNVTAYSDIRLKENIEVIPNALDKVSQIRGVTYDRNDIENESRQAGVIAQEVEKVLPEVVNTDENGVKSVAYGNMVSLLIEAIKEQQKQIDELKRKLEEKV